MYARDGGSGAWTRHTTLEGNDDLHIPPHFGSAVAIDGDTLVVGAHSADGDFPDTGAAYVYERDASGAWQPRATLRPSTTQADEMFFGIRVAISGGTIAVGAPLADNAAAGTVSSGAVYTHVRDSASGNWSPEQVVRLAIQETGDLFGEVAIDGDTLVVGAPREDSAATGVGGNEADNSVQDSGAAYVFVRSGGVWSRQAYLKASNTSVADFFGQRIDVSGDRVIVGAPLEDNNDANNDNAGAAYVFVRNAAAGTWAQEAFLKPAGSQTENKFGSSVAIAGHTAAMGAPIGDGDRDGIAGALAWFARDAVGAWIEREQLVEVGYVVDLSGQTLVVGSPEETVAGMTSAGAAYVYGMPDTTPPVVTAPSDIVDFEASGPLTDVMLGAATVTDDSGEELTATPAPAGPFPLGETQVTWSATDSAGNAGSDTQMVRLADTTAPVVTAPADIEASAGDSIVLGDPTVVDAVGVTSVVHDWPGDDFPVGATVVTWTATDTSGNVGEDTQVVTILTAVEPLDLDINTFRATGRVKAGNSQSVTFTFKVKNDSGNTTDQGSATLVGTLGNTEVYRVTLAPITDVPGGPATSWDFPPHTPGPGSPTGTIDWVVTVEDGNADTDRATATTRVVP